jgi:PTH1 family peptidyl-tRNA hydrolase
MSEIRMVVGLGNPGSEYVGTRHNAGFEVVDLLADRLGVNVGKEKFGGCFGQAEYEGKKLILLKPQQYMNRSGQVVATAAGFYKLEPGDFLVVTDDMWLEPGMIRMRAKGSSGGHNGLEDIIARLGTTQFARLRIGIGQSGRVDSVDYVLGRPDAEDRRLIDEAAGRACEAALCWVREGVEAAMSGFNSPRAKESEESSEGDEEDNGQ